MRLAARFIALVCCMGLSACSHETAGPVLPAGSLISSNSSDEVGAGKVSFRSIYSFGKTANDGVAPRRAPFSSTEPFTARRQLAVRWASVPCIA